MNDIEIMISILKDSGIQIITENMISNLLLINTELIKYGMKDLNNTSICRILNSNSKRTILCETDCINTKEDCYYKFIRYIVSRM